MCEESASCVHGGGAQDPAVAPLILVVDDDDGVQAALRRLLQRAGYDVLLAHGLEEALLQMRTDAAVSLAVVDLNLEDVPGEHAVGALRAVVPELPVVTMSGSNRTGAGLPGVLAHLVKPFPFEDLVVLLCRHFGS